MKTKIVGLLLALVSGVSFAQGGTDCNGQYANGEAPQIVKQSLAKDTQALCSKSFAVMHSGFTHTPLWSAEHLTRERLAAARKMKRHNTFHPDTRLSPLDRAELNDYTRSGYDRGHMSPNGDQPDMASQNESFALSNMIPQDPDNNQNLWEGIESATRTLASNGRGVYVVTGPIFEGASIKRVNHRVLVPTFIFKAVYDPARREAAAYVTPNAPGMDYKTVSIAELEQRVGINLFPSMPASIKQHKMTLPEPTPHGFNNQAGHTNHGTQAGRDGHRNGFHPSTFTAFKVARFLMH